MSIKRAIEAVRFRILNWLHQDFEELDVIFEDQLLQDDEEPHNYPIDGPEPMVRFQGLKDSYLEELSDFRELRDERDQLREGAPNGDRQHWELSREIQDSVANMATLESFMSWFFPEGLEEWMAAEKVSALSQLRFKNYKVRSMG